MSTITVLDPTAVPPLDNADPGPAAGSLAGRVIGIRTDRTWRSFEWVVDEWVPLLVAAGAQVRRWCPGNRVGDDGERTAQQLAEFVANLDVGVVGLGN